MTCSGQPRGERVPPKERGGIHPRLKRTPVGFNWEKQRTQKVGSRTTLLKFHSSRGGGFKHINPSSTTQRLLSGGVVCKRYVQSVGAREWDKGRLKALGEV